MNDLRLLSLFLLIVALSGCMTSLTLVLPSKVCSSESPFHRSKVYSGIRGWVYVGDELFSGRTPFEAYHVMFFPVALVDFPLSLALDTLLLPVTLFLPEPE